MPSAEPQRLSEVPIVATPGARALALRGDVAMALAQARSVMRTQPKSARTLWDYGTILIDAGILAGVGFVPEQIGTPPPGARRFAAAGRGPERGRRMIEAGLRALHEALELGAPAAVRTDAGRALLALGRRDDARTLMEDAVRRAPADPNGRALLAMVLDRLGDYEAADEHRATAEAVFAAMDDEAGPLDVAALDRLTPLAERLVDQNAPEEAEALIGPAADRSEAHLPSMRIRARAALERGAPDAARPLALHAALMSDEPRSMRALLVRVAGSGSAPDGEMEALDAWMKAPASADALLAFARHLADHREWSLAAVALRRVIDMDEGRADAWQLLAGILLRTESADAARKAADKALAIAPDDADVRLAHARFLETVGDRAGSLGALQQATRLGADTEGLSLDLAARALDGGDAAAAVSALQRILVDTPDDVEALRTYVAALDASGRTAEAVVWARRLTAADGTGPAERQTLASLLLKRGRWHEATQRRATPAPPSSIQASIWNGGGVGRLGLCLYHRGADPFERSLLGLAVATTISADGGAVTALVPESLTGFADAVSAHLSIMVFGNRETRRALKDRRFAAAYPLADVMLASARLRRPIDGWLGGPTDAAAKDVYVLRARESKTPWPPLGKMTGAFRGEAGGAVRVVNAPAPERAAATLGKARIIVTDDPMTALLAVGLSRPTVLVEDAALGWWWGQSGDRCPWSNRMTLVRRDPETPVGPDALLDRLADAVERGGEPRNVGARPVSSLGERRVDDALDRFRAILGPIASPGTLACTKLEGGSRNHIVKVDAPAGARVIRPGRFPAPRVGFFEKEILNMAVAADAGVAPRVFAADPADGAFVIDFVDGEVMRSATLRRPENAVEAGRVLRRLHRLSGFRGDYDIFEKIARAVEALLNADDTAMEESEESLALVHRIAERLLDNAVPKTATHNDPLTRNFIRTETAMMLIDWECSAVADPHWEVAAMAAQAGVRDDARRAYLNAYFGREGHPAECRIHLFEAVCHFYWWIDARCDLLDGGDDGDADESRKDAAAWWRRFRRTVDDPAFAQSMRLARSYRYAPSDDA